MDPVTLRTERLVLSVPVESDIDAIFTACQDPDVQRYTTLPSPYERSHAEEFVPRAAEGWREGREQNWAVREGDTFAGMVGMYRTGDGSSELGYWMAPGVRGRGIATEAARAVVDWALSAEGLGLQRVEWRAVAGNIASARIARTLGFRYEGTLRQGLSARGRRDDGWIAAILPTDDRMPQPWPVLDD